MLLLSTVAVRGLEVQASCLCTFSVVNPLRRALWIFAHLMTMIMTALKPGARRQTGDRPG